MATSNPFPPCARFDQFQVDLTSGVLERSGVRVPLQAQPLQVLRVLLQAEGKVVTREELRKVLWPDDTFVDFELGVNTAVKKLRQALADPADRPNFIETLPRIGYRFLIPVQWVLDERGKGATSYPQVNELASPPPLTATTSKVPSESHMLRRIVLTLACTFLAVLSGTILWRSFRSSHSSLPAPEIVPLVATSGGQIEPAFSPDGNQVAFVHVRDANAAGIYITLIDGGNPLRLTDNTGDAGPAWSPDSRQIAFGRHSKDNHGRDTLDLYAIPALGGTPRKLYSTTTDEWRANNYLSWSPDGKVLAFTDSAPDGSRSWISLLSLTDLTARPLTSPQENHIDGGAVFSPDGSTILFNRKVGWQRDLLLLPTTGGTPRQITFDDRQIFGYTWTEDGSDVVFASNRGGLTSLWRVSASGGAPRPIQGVGAPAYRPSIPRTGNRLAYTQFFYSSNIWRLNLKEEKNAQGSPVRVTSTTLGLNGRPDVSLDGKKIALDSDRLGYSDIWSCDSDGSNCAQITSFQRETGTARWSPDGHYLVFESQAHGREDVYVTEVPGGPPRLVHTFPGANNGAPNWSRDGQWIYFYSDQQGLPYQLWKVPFKGGSPVQVTKNGGVYAIESEDRRLLYYSKFTQPGVWKMPLNGGDETLVLDQPAGDHWYDWVPTRDGIYFLKEEPPNGKIYFFDFATKKAIPIWALEKPAPLGGGLALSPDGKSLLFSQQDFSDLHIMLVKNFR